MLKIPSNNLSHILRILHKGLQLPTLRRQIIIHRIQLNLNMRYILQSVKHPSLQKLHRSKPQKLLMKRRVLHQCYLKLHLYLLQIQSNISHAPFVVNKNRLEVDPPSNLIYLLRSRFSLFYYIVPLAIVYFVSLNHYLL